MFPIFIFYINLYILFRPLYFVVPTVKLVCEDPTVAFVTVMLLSGLLRNHKR